MANKKNHPNIVSNHNPDLSLKAALLPAAIPLSKIIPIQKIVRLSQLELASKVEEALNDNPFLERELPDDRQAEVQDSIIDKPLEIGDYYNSQTQVSIDENRNILEEVNPSQDQSLTGDLLEQLDWLKLPAPDRMMAETIISLIGEKGYIDYKEAENVRKEMGFSKKNFSRIWEILKKNLDPPGVVCTGIEDSLIIQLLRKGFTEDDLSIKIVRNFFPLLSKKQYAPIAKALNVTIKKVKTAIGFINTVDPYPLRNRSSEGEFDNNIIVPDVVIKHREGYLEVMINRETVPRIRLLKDVINKSLKSKSFTDKTAKSYLKEKKEEAETLIQAIDFRESNLKRIIDYLVEKQKDFFIEGFSRLQPCRMGDVGKNLGIDKGSLSRLVNSKYVSTDWGTFRLREMFSLPVYLNGKKISPKLIEEKIKTITKEFSAYKLSDQKIAIMLKELGYPIARRTVNKYRKRIEKNQ